MKKTASIAGAAAHFKCSRRTIERLLSAGEVKSRRRGNCRMVNLEKCRDALMRHGKMSLPSQEPEIPPEVAEAIEQDPSGLLVELASDPAKVAEMSPAVARVVVNACEAVRRERDAERKSAGLLKPEKFVQDLRGAAQLWIDHAEKDGAARLAKRIVALLKEHFSVNLSKHAGALSILENAILDDVQIWLNEFSRSIDERCEAVKPKD